VSSSPAGPFIEAAVVAICAWQIAQGFRTGNMHFGVSTISIDCKRRTDPNGFWIYGAFNALTAGAMIWLMIHPR
jgi:hypothetical protein